MRVHSQSSVGRDGDLLGEREVVPSGSVEEDLVGLCERRVRGRRTKGGSQLELDFLKIPS